MSRTSWYVCLLCILVHLMGCSPPVLDEVSIELLQDAGEGATERVFVEELRDGGEGSTTERAPREESVTPDVPVRAQLPWRGITMSCPRNGRIYATEGMDKDMKEAQGLGANWISYHPYGRIRNDGQVQKSYDDTWASYPLATGQKLGMKVFLIPHLAYWGSRFSWRGEISFEDEASWKRFFADYTAWIVELAQHAEAGKADLFAVGIEYKKAEHRESDWRAVIEAVRKVYSGKITYAANWDSYKQVPFWDAVDYIGVQAYFPLSDVTNPSKEDINKGWDKVLQDVGSFAASKKKQVIFTELGYNRSADAAKMPWDYTQGGEFAHEIKLRCMETALERLNKPSFLQGVFLWKWFPDARTESRDFILQYPEMKEVIRASWVKSSP